MRSLVLVMAGGAIGAALRWQAGRVAADRFGSEFPWGTFGVNLLGGLAAGLAAGLLLRDGGSADLRLFLFAGLLGGFTTFSAFSLETVQMIERGEIGAALAYVLASVLGAILLLFAGLWAARAVAA